MTETINDEVRRHETSLAEGTWLRRVSPSESLDLAKLSKVSHEFFDLFNKEYFQGQLPQPLISFQGTGREAYGHFRLGRNDIGAKFEINLNGHYIDRPPMEILSTLLHEMGHLAQDALPKTYGRHSKSQYHNKRFKDLLASQGIPCSDYGCTLEIRDPFKAFCIRHGVEVIEYCVASPGAPEGGKVKRKLRKWVCRCEKAYGVWAAVGLDLKARCNICQADFALAER